MFVSVTCRHRTVLQILPPEKNYAEKKHMGHRAAFLGDHLLSSLLNRQGVKDPFCVLQKYKKLQNKPLSGSESILISPFKPRGLRTSRIAGSAWSGCCIVVFIYYEIRTQGTI